MKSLKDEYSVTRAPQRTLGEWWNVTRNNGDFVGHARSLSDAWAMAAEDENDRATMAAEAAIERNDEEFLAKHIQICPVTFKKG